MRARWPRLSPIRRRPGWHARGEAAALAVTLLLLVGACNGPSASPGGDASGTPAATTSASADASTEASPSTEASASPSSGPDASPTSAPSPSPTARPTGAGPSASASSGGTAVCFGSADTRDFFDSFAQSVSWPVYCVVLPKGWSVEHGSFQLKNGGRLTISYVRRADGARVVLDEGAVCAETNPCVPPGSDLGTTALADRQADLSSSASGTYAAVVDVTENPAWLLTGSSISQKDFESVAARLHLIDR